MKRNFSLSLMLLSLMIVPAQAQKTVFGVYHLNAQGPHNLPTSIELHENYSFDYYPNKSETAKHLTGNFELQDKNTIVLKFEDSTSEKYLYKNKKLFYINKQGKVVKRGGIWGGRWNPFRRGVTGVHTGKIYLKKS